MILLGLAFLILSAASFASAECTVFNTPRIRPPDTQIILSQGKESTYDFQIENMNESNVIYSYSVISGKVSSIQISNTGFLRVTADESSEDPVTLGIVAIKAGCAGILLVDAPVLLKPEIISYTPVDEIILVEEGDSVLFSILAVTKNPDKRVLYDWYLGGVRLEMAKRSSYTLVPELVPGGKQNLTVVVYDYYGTSSEKTWQLSITKNNQPPVQTAELPTVILFKNVASEGFNLNQYFIDPERGPLKYSWKQVTPVYEDIKYANISITLLPDGTVVFYPENDTKGYAYFTFTAADSLGARAESNTTRVDVLEGQATYNITSTQFRYFCGDSQCNGIENCTICPEDCGTCDEGDVTGCNVEWNCTVWEACQPEGVQYRTCKDIYNCDDNRTMPLLQQPCLYNATCQDGLWNGIETGVDCGEACSNICPNCTDKIMNGNETGVDCGGQCDKECPSCFNGKKDGNETDSDCGGNCKGCAGDKTCKSNKDCSSLQCKYMKCTFPSCSDQIKNQGEKGIDCEGPCEAVCHNCNDKIMNGNEEGIDCGGGFCRPCETCQDGLKNQDELLIDCGGSCGWCGPGDYWKQFRMSILVLLGLFAFIILDLLVYFSYLMSHPEKAELLYESNTFFILMTGIHKGCRRCRKLFGTKPFLSPEDYNGLRLKIARVAVKDTFTSGELHQLIHDIIGEIFALAPGFDDATFFSKARASKISPFIKILLVGFYKKTARLLTQKYVPFEEKQAFLAELKYLLLELSKN